MSWLLEVAQVAIALLPVVAAVGVIIGAGLAMYAQVAGLQVLGGLAAQYISTAHTYLIPALDYGVNKPLFLFIMRWVNFPTFVRCVLYVVGLTMALVTTALFVVESIAAGLLAIHVYRKAKLFANMLAARGAIE